jgi:hypothetical protein
MGRNRSGSSFLRLRGADFLSSEPLAQYYKSITDLKVGTSERDVALVPRAIYQSVGVDSSTRDIVDLLETLPALTDNVLGRSIRNNDRDEVAVSLALRRERLSEREGDGG